MSPIQQMLLGAGAVATKTYIDDIFSTFVYAGTGANRSINNGIDMSSSGGGLTWIKKRTGSESHYLFDTERGSGKYLQSNGTNAEGTNNDYLSAFNNNGFSLGDYNDVNGSGQDYASWTFRKAPGFFDVVTYTGNSTAGRQVSHNLGSIPGLMIVKCTSSAGEPWYVYHKDLGATKHLKLNTNSASSTSSEPWNNTEPTSTHFTLAQYNSSNGSGKTYVAYLFAGGESTAATAKCVEFDGNDALTSATSNDLSFGTGDYTVEFWFNADAISDTPLFENRVSGSASDTTGFTLTAHGSTNGVRIWWNGASRINGGGSSLSLKQWHHLAATRSSGTTYLFLNGTLLGTTTDSIDITTTEAHIAGGKYGGSSSLSHYFDGKISNFRIVKGTAVYTSSFKPSYEPLTNITNTKLLCCNGSTATSSTVNVGGISYVGNPTGEIDSPFDDPAGFVFGESGSENVIKCGSHSNSVTENVRIYTGWEPQWVMTKNASVSSNWAMFDCIRGIVVGGDGPSLAADSSAAENGVLGANQFVIPHGDGFSLKYGGTAVNPGNGNTIIYIAIRRPDGYVGKPPEIGTSVFAMDTAASSVPRYSSGFPVDFAFKRRPATSESWYTGARIIGKNRGYTDASTAFSDNNSFVWDSSTHWPGGGGDDANVYQAWMWKRHAGFDVVCYEGNQTNRDIKHSMGIAPTMVWLKSRTSTEAWVVGSSGLSSWAEYLTLNNNDGESTNAGIFNSKAPTATHFSLGTQNRSNENNQDYIAFLFASVSGISSVGSYTGNGQTGSSGTFVTTGFQPRLVWVKRIDGHGQDWPIYDSLRGFNADTLYLNENNAATAVSTAVEVSSTGFRLITNNANTNGNTDEYIYYAHA